MADGDTITVLQNSKQYKIRLYGIDTPEKKQDFGKKAKRFTSSMVFKQHVKVVAYDSDRYGRTVKKPEKLPEIPIKIPKCFTQVKNSQAH